MSSRKNKKSIEREDGAKNLDLINELADQGVRDSASQRAINAKEVPPQQNTVHTGIELLEGFDKNITDEDLKSNTLLQQEPHVGDVERLEQARTRNDVKLKRDIVLMKSNNSSRVDTGRVVITAQSALAAQNTVT